MTYFVMTKDKKLSPNGEEICFAFSEDEAKAKAYQALLASKKVTSEIVEHSFDGPPC